MLSVNRYTNSPLGLILDQNYNEPLTPIHGPSGPGLGNCMGCGGNPPGLGWITVDTTNSALKGLSPTTKFGAALIGLSLGVGGGLLLWAHNKKPKRSRAY